MGLVGLTALVASPCVGGSVFPAVGSLFAVAVVIAACTVSTLAAGVTGAAAGRLHRGIEPMLKIGVS